MGKRTSDIASSKLTVTSKGAYFVASVSSTDQIDFFSLMELFTRQLIYTVGVKSNNVVIQQERDLK